MPSNELTNPIAEFRNRQDPQRLEELADVISQMDDPRAIEALLDRLPGDRVQQDPDVEIAVCDALVAFGVMRPDGGNLYYKFVDLSSLPPQVATWIQANYLLPRKYF